MEPPSRAEDAFPGLITHTLRVPEAEHVPEPKQETVEAKPEVLEKKKPGRPKKAIVVKEPQDGEQPASKLTPGPKTVRKRKII